MSQSFVINTINVGIGPLGISSDGTNVWVSNYADTTVSKILASTHTVTATITVGNAPAGVSSDGTNAWVCNFIVGPLSVSKINTSTNGVTMVGSVDFINGTYALASDGTYVWIVNSDANSYLYRLTISDSSVTSFNIGSSYTFLKGVTYDNTYVYVAVGVETYILRFLKSNISAGFTSLSISPAVATGISCDPNGGYIWVSNTSNNVLRINTSNFTTITSIAIGFASNGISSDGTFAWATTTNNTVVEFDVVTGTIIGLPISVGSNPQGISSDGSYVWVANNLSNTVSQIQIIGKNFNTICFKIGTKILTDNGYMPIQNLKKGDFVKTVKHDYVAINMIGHKEIHHCASKERIKDQLYVCSKKMYPELFEDLIITGCHCILVDSFIDAEQRQHTIDINGDTFVTDNKYRLPACADYRADVYEKEGSYMVYHFALEHDDYYMNYGVFANGLLVETCSKKNLKELSNMELIE